MPDNTKQLFIFPDARRHDPQVDAWFGGQTPVLSEIAQHWFNELRQCGGDVHELLHDGHPTACVQHAAFAYVDVFTRHVNVGFFRGAELYDADEILLGNGKLMRHVKLGNDHHVASKSLKQLIRLAYQDMQARLNDT